MLPLTWFVMLVRCAVRQIRFRSAIPTVVDGLTLKPAIAAATRNCLIACLLNVQRTNIVARQQRGSVAIRKDADGTKLKTAPVVVTEMTVLTRFAVLVAPNVMGPLNSWAAARMDVFGNTLKTALAVARTTIVYLLSAQQMRTSARGAFVPDAPHLDVNGRLTVNAPVAAAGRTVRQLSVHRTHTNAKAVSGQNAPLTGVPGL